MKDTTFKRLPRATLESVSGKRGALAHVPVFRGTVFFQWGKIAAVDNGAGTLISQHGVTGTIDYVTGEWCAVSERVSDDTPCKIEYRHDVDRVSLL